MIRSPLPELVVTGITGVWYVLYCIIIGRKMRFCLFCYDDSCLTVMILTQWALKHFTDENYYTLTCDSFVFLFETHQVNGLCDWIY